LLLVQVIYKITTPLTVGSFENPVLISNLVVAVMHTVPLTLIFLDRRAAAGRVVAARMCAARHQRTQATATVPSMSRFLRRC